MAIFCNGVNSENLVIAVCEQTETFREQGGFCTDQEYEQFIRDVYDVARKLYIAEQVINAESIESTYKSALKYNVIEEYE